MKKSFILVAGLCFAMNLSAQQTEIPANYWDLFAANYEEYDSWWEVDDQTKNVHNLTGLTPKNGMTVDPSQISNNAYKITPKDDVFQVHYEKTKDYEKFQLGWMNWEYSSCSSDNWQLKNPITGEDWGEGSDCHRTAKGYSVDFSDPANRIVYFKYQAIGDGSINLRVDLCDIKGRKTTKLGYICTDALDKSNSYVPTEIDPDAWKEFMIIYTNEDNEPAYEELGEYFDNSLFYQTSNVGLADGHNTWFNGIQFPSEPPSNFNLWLDSTRITAIEIYINCDVATKGQVSDIYIKDLTIGNTLTREPEEVFTAIETIEGNSKIEIVDGTIYSEGEIVIYNSLGQVVKTGQKELSINNLPKGSVYIINTAEGRGMFVK